MHILIATFEKRLKILCSALSVRSVEENHRISKRWIFVDHPSGTIWSDRLRYAFYFIAFFFQNFTTYYTITYVLDKLKSSLIQN